MKPKIGLTAALMTSFALGSEFDPFPTSPIHDFSTPDPGRQKEVDDLPKDFRKFYCKTLRETQDRDLALKATQEAYVEYLNLLGAGTTQS